jgi:uroporphyrinogen decarboxylase
MKPRDRVFLALNHEIPDRCPMQISFTPEFADRLKEDMGLTESDLHNPHGGGNTYRIERELGEDMLLTSIGWANSYYRDQVTGTGRTYTDEWGIIWKSIPYDTRYGRGRYTEMVGHPLAKDEAIESYTPCNPGNPELYADAERTIRDFKSEYWIVGVTVTTIFETAWALRGYERMLMDFVDDPGLAERILDIPFHYHLEAARRLTELGVDMIWVGDDVGAQNAMLISPGMWRRFLKPRMAQFISEIKGINPRLKVAYHSDGYIRPIIADLIDIGVDVLNPVQPKSMDPEGIKREFGDRLSFWGTVDEQHTLPFGTPEDVTKEVRERIATVGKSGGLVIGPTHHVQLDTPLENFWAMVRTIRETPCA